MIRVLIVDDSITFRAMVASQLSAAGMQVVGEASHGEEAVAMTATMRPDVVLMDLMMPRVDGLEATKQIMQKIPTPIIMLTAYADHTETMKTFDALAYGALEVCAKPTGSIDEQAPAWNRIMMTISAAKQVVVTRLRQSRLTDPKQPVPVSVDAKEGGAQLRIVAIGASTGGPTAVRSILSSLPSDFPFPIIVAIHCSTRICASVADWFSGRCSLHVRDTKRNERIPQESGIVLTVPPGMNTVVRNGRIACESPKSTDVVSPSIDQLFTSLACEYQERMIGVLLTGMGTDGARGLKEIKEHGGYTIAQDEQTSVVFGMPAAAIEIGATRHGVSLDRIPRLLEGLATRVS